MKKSDILLLVIITGFVGLLAGYLATRNSSFGIIGALVGAFIGYLMGYILKWLD